MRRPIVRSAIAVLGLATAAAIAVGEARNVRGIKSSAAPAEANAIACRAMESHASEEPSAPAVVFHHRDKVEGPRLGELLLKNSGATVEIQIGRDGKRQTARAFRLKSCFGRGLLLLPHGTVAAKDGETFTVMFPASANTASH